MVEDHSHAPISSRFKMLKSYSQMKTTAASSEQSTRSILSTAVKTSTRMQQLNYPNWNLLNVQKQGYRKLWSS